MTKARIDWRPRAYELVALGNLVVIYLATMKHTDGVLLSLPQSIFAGMFSLAVQGLAGVLIRVIVGVVRGNAAQYVAVIRRPVWLVESARLLFSAALMIHVYCWIKISIPILHPPLFDQQLWNLDRVLFFGISPNIFFLNLFSSPAALSVVDITYGPIFLIGLFVGFGYFVSSPSNRLRIAFITGHALMWIGGGWLYVLIPSLGPAYRFPQVWLEYANNLSRTQSLQAHLWVNYSKVLRLRAGLPLTGGPVNILHGIAAFPSMHVAFQTFIFLWFRRVWKWGELLFAIFVLMIFLGALITGWHYLIDLYAGMLLAWIVWFVTARRYRVNRFARLTTIS
jgi:PAP2 superfamily